MPEEREICVCPECDSADVHVRNTLRSRGPPTAEDAPRWRCNACKATFDQPDTRLAKHDPSPPAGSVAATLLDHDPEDLSDD
jgi:transposase-like protein